MTAMPAVDPRSAPGWRRLAAGAVDYGIVAVYLNGVLLLNVMMLFFGARRPLYDRLADTIVQVVPSAVDRGRRSR